MRAFDDETIRGVGVPGVVLMESAGRAVASCVVAALGGGVAGRRVAVVCGPGNNGGDGYVAARWLADAGAHVTVIRCADADAVRGDARVHHDAALHSGVELRDGRAPAWPAAGGPIDDADAVVDALLGTGTARDVVGHFADVIARINAARGVVVAADLPSGLDADSGRPLGVCVEADHTVTFGFAKLGLCGAPGFLHVGELHVADIGIPARLAARVTAHLLDESCLEPLRRPRARDAHKGTHGHLLVVAGSRGRTGAALLAAEAAARTGAGLVTVASGDVAQAALSARVTEVMTASLGPEPLEPAAAWSALEPLLDGKRAVAAGPGVERSPAMRAILGRLLATFGGPVVLDADALNLVAEDPALLAPAKGRLVLTPHPAEMARLARLDTASVQADRVGVARRFAAAHGAVVALKGARTVVASPDGRVAINPTGNPGMGSGGTGDVLTGMVGALLAAGMARHDAACAAVYLHGAAGDLVASERGEAGLLARDLVDAIPRRRARARPVG